MTDREEHSGGYRRAFVLVLTISTCLAFAYLIRSYLLPVFLAGLFGVLLYPVYSFVKARLGTGPSTTSGLVVAGFAVAVGIPVFAIAGLAAAEALAVREAVKPWLEKHVSDGAALAFNWPEWMPFGAELEKHQTQILERLGELTGKMGELLFNVLNRATRNTLDALLGAFIFGYALFSFLGSGPHLADKTFSYLPLTEAERRLIVERGLKVMRATLKSILIIGALQGALVGVAFWVLGLDGAVFWGAVVALLSAIPFLGSGFVWVPAAAYLFATGKPAAAIGLFLWGALVVGVVDNILRPWLVGGEAKIPDVLILLSILGGIGAFGVMGIIIGPVLAAMLLTVLEIYASEFPQRSSR